MPGFIIQILTLDYSPSQGRLALLTSLHMMLLKTEPTCITECVQWIQQEFSVHGKQVRSSSLNTTSSITEMELPQSQSMWTTFHLTSHSFKTQLQMRITRIQIMVPLLHWMRNYLQIKRPFLISDWHSMHSECTRMQQFLMLH